MFGSIGMPELVLIFIVALLVFGPKKLPEIGKSIGKGLAEFKRASDDLKRTIELEIEQGKQEAASVREQVTGIVSAAVGSTAASAETSAAPPAAVDTTEGRPPAPAQAVQPPDSRPIEPS